MAILNIQPTLVKALPMIIPPVAYNRIMNTREQQATLRMQSIINFKELYLQQRERRIELEKQLQLEKIKLKRMNSTASGKNKTRYCAHCSNNLSRKDFREETSLIEEFKDFSEKMSTLRFPSNGECMEPSLMSKLNGQGSRHVGMVQNFAIFGLREGKIQEVAKDGKVGDLQGEILYSKKEKHDIEMQAAKFVFPSGMGVKKCLNHKAKEKTIELMSYCYTNLKSFVLSFECPEQAFPQRFNHNQLLEHVNPAHRLYCICIGIHDYTWIDPTPTRLNISLGNIEPFSSSGSLPDEPAIKSEGHEFLALSQKDSQRSLEQGQVGELQVGITQRVFCIMSYYPFFSFYQQVLRNLINIVKMQRLAIYKHNQQNIKLTIKQTDSRFQMERLVELFDHCYHDLEFKKVAFNKEYELRLINQQKLTLMTDWDDGKTYFIREWVYSVLSMFTLENFLDVWTLLMLEDKLVFICDNSNILTHTVHLFTSVLTRPLQYPFPIVSIIPTHEDEEFLSAPMPIVYGILKKRKAIEERNMLQNFDMTYIFLSPEKVEVVCQQNRKQLLANRPWKLLNSKEMKESFRDLKKTRKKEQKSARYEIESSEYCILASSEEKQRALRIVSAVNQYLSEEVVQRLPNHIEVENMRKKLDEKQMNPQKDEHSCLMEMIAGQIKKITKDSFVTQVLNTQMVNNFVFK